MCHLNYKTKCILLANNIISIILYEKKIKFGFMAVVLCRKAEIMWRDVAHCGSSAKTSTIRCSCWWLWPLSVWCLVMYRCGHMCYVSGDTLCIISVSFLSVITRFFCVCGRLWRFKAQLLTTECVRYDTSVITIYETDAVIYNMKMPTIQ